MAETTKPKNRIRRFRRAPRNSAKSLALNSFRATPQSIAAPHLRPYQEKPEKLQSRMPGQGSTLVGTKSIPIKEG
jgi:hypothetical protein